MSKLIPKAYKFRFYPQDDLKIILAKTFGCVRFVYNKTLDFSEKHYAQKDIIDNYKNLTGTDRTCAGNVRPKTSKLNSTKKSRAVSNETRILVL